MTTFTWIFNGWLIFSTNVRTYDDMMLVLCFLCRVLGVMYAETTNQFQQGPQ